MLQIYFRSHVRNTLVNVCAADKTFLCSKSTYSDVLNVKHMQLLKSLTQGQKKKSKNLFISLTSLIPNDHVEVLLIEVFVYIFLSNCWVRFERCMVKKMGIDLVPRI